MKKIIFSIFLLITLGLSNKSFAQQEKSVSIVYQHYDDYGKYNDGSHYYNLYPGIANYTIEDDGVLKDGGQIIKITCYKVDGIQSYLSSYCFPGGIRVQKGRNVVGGKEYNYYIPAAQFAGIDNIFFN